MAERFLIDSNIHDKIIDVPGALDLVSSLAADGSIMLLTTYIQADEIARTPDEQRRARLAAVPVEQVPTYGLVLGYWRLGEARLSGSEPFESLRGENIDHTEDALIGATAQYEDAVLVTEDRQLAARARAEAIPVIDWQEFHDRLDALAGR